MTSSKKAAIAILAVLTVVLIGVVVYRISSMSQTGNFQEQNMPESDVEAPNPIPFDELGVDPDSAAGYYYQNADVYSVQDAQSSPNAVSEAEVVAAVLERGFEDAIITTHYDQDGMLIDSMEISDQSDITHPVYLLPYATESGDYWTVYIYDGDVMASPLTYLYGDAETEVIVSEHTYITSYDSQTNCFYRNMPNDGSCEVYTVEKIDTKTLDKLSAEVFGGQR